MIANLKGQFKILDYRISHKILLLRASYRKGDEFYNKDILFTGVFYIEIHNDLENPIVRQGNEEEIEYVKERCSFKVWQRFLNVFIIECGTSKFYIGATKIDSVENCLPPLESGIA